MGSRIRSCIKECKRLAEVDFPIAVVSRDAAQPGATKPQLQEPINDPARFPWHEVTKVAHYWLEVNVMTKPMQVCEDSPPDGGRA